MTHQTRAVYEKIATHFDNTRYISWPSVINFVMSLEANSHMLDVGCGNGRNMQIRNDIHSQGCDFCSKFVEICRAKKLDVREADCRILPYLDDSFDYTISIAVIHHLETSLDRQMAVQEMIRVTKPGGKIFIQVWATHLTIKPNKITRLDTENDCLISWHLKDDETVQRYYHLFTMEELRDLVVTSSATIEDLFEDHDNWCIILKKH
jgi:ubiquinone/menaquinone biosynthesis C-methylase UbiE